MPKNVDPAVEGKGTLMNQTGTESTATEQRSSETAGFIKSFWGVRYQVKDVRRSVAFYTSQLGFKLDQQTLPPFAQVSVGSLKLILSGPGASGSRRMPDGRSQEPGGWNRVLLQVTDLQNLIEALKKTGIRFRNEMEVGPGGKQIQLEDPDGNPIELFEPA
jgi:glyoxylase I family protein